MGWGFFFFFFCRCWTAFLFFKCLLFYRYVLVELQHRTTYSRFFCRWMHCTFLLFVSAPAISYRPQWRVYGVDYSSECHLLQYWGEPQLGPSKYHSFYVRDLGHCHDGVQISDSCYRLSEDVEGSLEWTAASAACIAWGGHLVTLDDSSEAAALASTLRPKGDAARWIGLSTEGDCSGEYHWANDAQVDMTASFLQFVSSSAEAAEAETDAHCASVSRLSRWTRFHSTPLVGCSGID